jgi:hypothetical protein
MAGIVIGEFVRTEAIHGRIHTCILRTVELSLQGQ